MKTVLEHSPVAGLNQANTNNGLTQARPFAQPYFQLPPPRVAQFKQEPPTDGGVPLPAQQADPVAAETPTAEKPIAEPEKEPTVKPTVEATFGMAPKCGVDATAQTDPRWEEFAVKFNVEFASVLHMFSQDAVGCNPDADAGKQATASPKVMEKGKEKYPQKGEKSGADVSGATLASLFTTTQRDLLLDFMNDSKRTIPERLFNGDDVGNTTAQQRILLSAHILMVGHYSPAGFEQSLHARNCGHWVEVVHAYAGAAAGGMARGRSGNVDQDGNVILTTQSKPGKGKETAKVLEKDLPKKEEDEIGPIWDQTDHRETVCKVMNMPEDPTGEKKKPEVMRFKGIPFSDFKMVQPGDWLWDYNSNASNSGGHSLIFSHWASDELEKDGVKYRRAVCFSQGSPEGGGREHHVNFGEQFYLEPKPVAATPAPSAGTTPTPDATGAVKLPDKPADMPVVMDKARQAAKKPKEKKIQYSACDPTQILEDGQNWNRFMISPITRIMRVNDDARPVTSVDELDTDSPEKQKKSADQNSALISKVEHKYGFKLDLPKLHEYLSNDGESNLKAIFEHTTSGQDEVLSSALESDKLEQVVWVVQKLRALKQNVTTFDTLNAANTDKLKPDFEAKWKGNTDVITKYKTEIDASQTNIDTWEKDKAKATGYRDLRKKIDERTRLLKTMKTGTPKYTAKEAELTQWKDQLDALNKADTPTPAITDPTLDPTMTPAPATNPYMEKSVKTLSSEIEKLEKSIKNAKYKIKTAEGKRKGEMKTLPFSLVHPGNWGKKEDRSVPTGQLKDIFGGTDAAAIKLMKDFLSTEALPVEPKKQSTRKRRGSK